MRRGLEASSEATASCSTKLKYFVKSKNVSELKMGYCEGRKEESRSVSRVLSRTAIPLRQPSLTASSNLPGSSAGHADGSLFGLAPSGVYLATDCCQPRGALLPHLFTLTGTEVLRRLFSVALSVGSRLPGVTWHFALWSPDFPPSLFAEQKETATVRSTLQAPEYRRNVLPASSPGGTRPRPTSYLRSSAAWYNRFLRTPVISAAIAAARLSGISANSRSSTRSASALTALSSSGACQPSTSTTHSPRC